MFKASAKFLLGVVVISAALTAASCAGSRQRLPQSAVKHVVVIWLKDHGNAQQRQLVIDSANSFVKIPGVLRVEAGTVLPSNRPQVDSSYDVAVVITVEDENALDTYQQHPLHQQAVEKVLKPFVAKYIVYDFRP